MSVYEEFRASLLTDISPLLPPQTVTSYQWDPLPNFPCHSQCMASHLARRARRDVSSSDPAVLYLPLGGGGGGGCPSLAENAVVAVSQMTFLWTVMSVFNVVANVVANINNNQNNRLVTVHSSLYLTRSPYSETTTTTISTSIRSPPRTPRSAPTPTTPTRSPSCCRHPSPCWRGGGSWTRSSGSGGL